MRNLKKARRNTCVLAYKTLCHPKLEYASPTWSPHLLKHKKLIKTEKLSGGVSIIKNMTR